MPVTYTEWHARTGVHAKGLPNCKVKISLSFSPENGPSTQHLSGRLCIGSKKQKCCQVLLTAPGSCIPNPDFTNPQNAFHSSIPVGLKPNFLSPSFLFQYTQNKNQNVISSSKNVFALCKLSPCNKKETPNQQRLILFPLPRRLQFITSDVMAQ